MAPVDGFRAWRRSPIGVIAGLAACVLGAFRGAPLAAQTPAGTVIANRAYVTYTSANGGADSATSNTVILTVGRLGGITLVPVQTVQALPGDSVVFVHTLTNAQNLDDALTLSAISSTGWPVSILHDRNGNDTVDAGDTPWTGADSLPAGGAATVLVVVAVPNTRAVRGVTDLVTVTAVSAWLAPSRFGYGLTAIREDEDAAAAMGINTPLYKTLAFALSGASTPGSRRTGRRLA